MIPALVPLHGIGSRKDLPLPFEWVVVGAAAVLVVTFVVALRAWREPRYRGDGGRPLPGLERVVDARPTRIVAALAVWFATLWAALALVAGQDRLTNPIFGWVFACVWVGLVPVSLLFGGVWRALHPVGTLIDAVGWRGLRRLPARVGVWPAALGLAAFAFFELVQPGRATLPVLQIWACVWAAWVVGGAVIFGRDWLPAADPFTAYADLVARLSPWQRVDGRLRLVSPLRHLTSESDSVSPGTTAIGVVLLGATMFDSFSGGTWWVTTMQANRWDPVVAGTLGLLAFIAAIAALVWAGLLPCRGLRRFGATLAPLAAGYAIGHYATLLFIEGQRTMIYASDPLGKGWNVFGTAELGVNMGFADYPTAVALVQLVGIVGGHVLGVVAAHEESLRILPMERRMSGQVGLLISMVIITCAGLLLLFAA